MSTFAIRAEGLGKRYSLGRYAGYGRLTESISNAVRSPLRRRTRRDELWALRDVSFVVEPGSVVGVIGRNGAGKSTLLKLLSRITEPTEGAAYLRGRVGSLLEVGTGFHPELTGRENLYLNGAILGMPRREIDARFDEIVEFAGVERFIDTPVKRYSSGMHVRLAFSVAAHLEPEVLIVDEVLAVGDAAFQRKCIGKMEDVATRDGRTVLFVSHGMDSVRSLCQRAIWLDAGRIVQDGPSAEVVGAYLEEALRPEAVELPGRSDPERESRPLSIDKVVVTDEAGQPVLGIPFGGSLRIEVHYYAPRRVERPQFWIGIGEELSVAAAISFVDGIAPDWVEGEGTISCTFRDIRLLPRFYNIAMGVRDEFATADLVPNSVVGHFEVEGSPSSLGLHGPIADTVVKTCAPVVFPYEWELPDGRRAVVDPMRSMRELA